MLTAAKIWQYYYISMECLYDIFEKCQCYLGIYDCVDFLVFLLQVLKTTINFCKIEYESSWTNKDA